MTTEVPRTRYARSGDVSIAYQVHGDGPIRIVHSPGFATNVEADWESTPMVAWLKAIGRMAHVVRFDKRGTGMSDRVPIATLEERMDDVRSVMDAVGWERAALWGASEGGPMSILFAATFPERVDALVLSASFARFVADDDYPWMLSLEEREALDDTVAAAWGTGKISRALSPDLPLTLDEHARRERQAASPGAVRAILAMNRDIDVRAILPTLRVPTLVIHNAGDPVVPVGNGRYLAEHIPGARFVELPSSSHTPSPADAPAHLSAISEFLTGSPTTPPSERALGTILFTDIVESTAQGASRGDAAWRDLLDRHDDMSRREVERHRGRVVKHTGDGMLALFDGPGRAAQCALAITRDVEGLGIAVRAGVHTGEVEQRGDDISGYAVNLAARIAAHAGAGEVLASRTVRDLVAGSDLRFVDRGTHRFKGIPEEWTVYRVE